MIGWIGVGSYLIGIICVIQAILGTPWNRGGWYVLAALCYMQAGTCFIQAKKDKA